MRVVRSSVAAGDHDAPRTPREDRYRHKPNDPSSDGVAGHNVCVHTKHETRTSLNIAPFHERAHGEATPARAREALHLGHATVTLLFAVVHNRVPRYDLPRAAHHSGNVLRGSAENSSQSRSRASYPSISESMSTTVVLSGASSATDRPSAITCLVASTSPRNWLSARWCMAYSTSERIQSTRHRRTGTSSGAKLSARSR